MTDYKDDWPSDEEIREDHDGCLKVAGFVFMIFVLLWLAGCESNEKMTAREIAVAAQECYDLDLRAILITDGWGNERIACRPHGPVNE